MSMEAVGGYSLSEKTGFSFERGVKSFAKGARQLSEDFVSGSRSVLSFVHEYVVIPTADTVMPLAVAMDPDDEYIYSAPRRIAREQRQTNRSPRYLGSSAAAVAFLAVLLAPGSFSSRPSNIHEDGRNILPVSESTAKAPDAPTYVRINSPEWRASRARLIRAYEQSRERAHPVSAPLPEQRHFGSVTVSTGVFSDEPNFQ